MKHIIDIDEDMYKQVIANDTVYVLDDIDLIMLENAIAEGKPLREEFEEIEADIKDTIKKFETSFGDTYSMNYLLYYVDKIFNNRISELKREDNENSN